MNWRQRGLTLTAHPDPPGYAAVIRPAAGLGPLWTSEIRTPDAPHPITAAHHSVKQAARRVEDALTLLTGNRNKFQWKFQDQRLTRQNRHFPDSESITATIYYSDAYHAEIRMHTAFTSLSNLKTWQQPQGWTQRDTSLLDRHNNSHGLKLLTGKNIPTLETAVQETEAIIEKLEARFMTAGEHLNRMREFAETTSQQDENEQ